MKRTIIIAGLLLASPAVAREVDIDQYVDEGDGFILLTVRCAADNVHPCNCAILSEELVAEDEDPFVCWNIEGDKIIFTNERRRIEKRLDEIKSRINNPSPSAVPRPARPISSDPPSGTPS